MEGWARQEDDNELVGCPSAAQSRSSLKLKVGQKVRAQRMVTLDRLVQAGSFVRSASKVDKTVPLTKTLLVRRCTGLTAGTNENKFNDGEDVALGEVSYGKATACVRSTHIRTMTLTSHTTQTTAARGKLKI